MEYKSKLKVFDIPPTKKKKKKKKIHGFSYFSPISFRFFDTTPTGRILNRFASDTQIIDIVSNLCKP